MSNNVVIAEQIKTNKSVNQSDNNPSGFKMSNTRIILFIVAFFFGYLGIQRFAVGKIGTGVVWLLTLGCLGIGWLVDWIMIISGKFKDKKGNLII